MQVMRTFVHSEVSGRMQPRPARRHRVQAPSILTIARELISTRMGLYLKARSGCQQQLHPFLRPQLTGGPPGWVPRGKRRIEFAEQLARDCFLAVAARNRREML